MPAVPATILMSVAGVFFVLNFSWESNFTLKQKFEMNKADFKERPNMARLSDVMTVSAKREAGSKEESLTNG